MSSLEGFQFPSLPSSLTLPYGLEWRTVLTGTALFTAGLITRGFLVSPSRAGIVDSPRKTLLPSLSKQQRLELPYPPDALPGARDIDTPFGSIRAYEFGPETGRKVLLVHGISTPCIALGGVANALVDKGCRVLMFDLPGRGYSDTPSDLPHDIRLFTSQILLVLSSSPLSWTGEGSGKFSLVGYSLGGGIAAAFASYFPNLVESLVLIAPSGLIREHRISRSSRFLYSEGVIPEPILMRLVKRRLQTPLYPPKKQPGEDEKAGAAQAVQAEVNIEGNQSVVLSRTHPDIKIEDAVTHQVLNHRGFVYAFMSSIRYGPVQRQHDIWRRIGKRLSENNKGSTSSQDKVLIVLGDKDPIINTIELQEDAIEVLEGNVEFRIMDAGHEAPVTKGDEVADYIEAFWKERAAS